MAERLMGWVSNVQEPKRLNRYELLLEDELRLTCKAVDMPKVEVQNVDVHRMHNLYKVAGSKVTYDDINITFYDFVDNKAATRLEEWHKQVYDLSTSLMGFPAEYKRNLTLLIYGPDHSVVESWLLVGAWPKSFTRQGLDWTKGDGTQEVQVNLSIDEAKLILSSTA